ncbi:hypothetical protein AB205_0077770 [Aquarana catesbeiana]|uniref:C-type natriuretic peptide n=1 Tax=Aquarana catesbeiana TaxID=8400 RepID=A0A2G9NNR5_AQUCT|nr:hypothetical protein AB205_0077770 [Aquarana catesbeiana]
MCSEPFFPSVFCPQRRHINCGDPAVAACGLHVRGTMHISLRALLGEELAEYLVSGERGERSIDPKTRARLLRDIRADTRSRAAWTRLLNEHPNSRKIKGINKKGTSKGCFGLKLDRIGAMSGLGC